MKTLVIGGGGREHALVWKLKKDNPDLEVFVAPGNGGTASLGKNIQLKGNQEIVEFAKNNQVDLVVIGPEAELVNGIIDELNQEKISAFGPHKEAAQLEGSKAFAKEFMQRNGVKTAAYASFNNHEKAKEYLEQQNFPIVIKASGLAAGKGVIIAQNKDEAHAALDKIMLDKSFGNAGDEVVIEEFLSGFESSIISIFNGKEISCFPAVKDHKKISEGETGLNTGGMGVVAPNPWFTAEHKKDFEENILNPTLQGLIKEGLQFAGVIFFGLMCTEKGVYLLEYNLRFGDPETQALMPLLQNNLLEVFQNAIQAKAIELKVSQENSCCLVLSSGGYPETYEKGKEITGLADLEITHFIAGAKEDEGKLLTSGGRVMNLVSTAANLEAAREKVYDEVKKIHFDKMYFRTDIGK